MSDATHTRAERGALLGPQAHTSELRRVGGGKNTADDKKAAEAIATAAQECRTFPVLQITHHVPVTGQISP